jgi:hypothetical protein
VRRVAEEEKDRCDMLQHTGEPARCRIYGQYEYRRFTLHDGTVVSCSDGRHHHYHYSHSPSDACSFEPGVDRIVVLWFDPSSSADVVSMPSMPWDKPFLSGAGWPEYLA